MTEDDFERIEKMMVRHIGVMGENVQHQLDRVVEGQQMLAERLDRVETRLDRVETRLTGVEGKVGGIAADLAAHRADTEAHRGVYRVREE